MWEHITEDWYPVLKSAGAAVVILIVILVFYLLARRALNLAVKRDKLSLPVATVLRLVIRWTALVLAVLLVLGEIGVLRNVWAALLAVGAMIAIGFVAVWSVLSNSLCTLLILIYKPFRVGDRVEVPVDNLAGVVVDLNLMFTTLRAEDGYMIQIPNNTFFQKAIRRTAGEQEADLYEQLVQDEPAG